MPNMTAESLGCKVFVESLAVKMISTDKVLPFFTRHGDFSQFLIVTLVGLLVDDLPAKCFY
jgi:hypothetical protein